MQFIKAEVESEERINLAMSGFGLNEPKCTQSYKKKQYLIGIDDPTEKKFKQEIDLQTKEHFLETVKINCGWRYEVCLPWVEDKSPLPNNLHLAQRRLEYTTSKLKNNNLYLKYEEIFASWLKDDIIEEIPLTEIYGYGNFCLIDLC
ncbi:uncharacterized protein TNCV_784441 [Trichonephila clavipes]|nr:uncharacterized protein TNCV_784441 [Trichonephila clavipes]